MTEDIATDFGYSVRPFFLISFLFILAAPVFWLRPDVPQVNTGSAAENAGFYQEVLPNYQYGFGRLHEGDLPLWNPQQLCGTPFQSNPASALFQPLNLIFAIFPLDQAVAIHAFLDLALMGVLFAFFLRSYGIGYIPATIGAVAYTFCGASAASVSRPAMGDVMAWSPLVFWGIHYYAKTYRVQAMVVGGLGAALVLVSGAIGLALVMLAMAGIYALFLLALPGTPAQPQEEPPPVLRRAEALTLGVVIALSVSAVQWLPSLAWLWSLDGPAGVLFSPDIPGSVSVSLRELLAQILAPKQNSLPQIAYFGVIPLLAIPASLFNKKSRGDALFYGTIGIICFVLAAGPRNFFLATISPAYFIFPAMFCFATLAALGFHRLLTPGLLRPRHRPLLPAATTLIASIFLFYIATASPRGRVVIFLLLLALIVIFRARWILVTAGILFAAIIFADLAAANKGNYYQPLEALSGFTRYIKTIQAAEEQAYDARVVVSTKVTNLNLPVNLGMIFPNIQCADGSAPLTADQTIWLRRLKIAEQPVIDNWRAQAGVAAEAAQPRLINFMCARAIIAGPESSMYSGQWQHDGPPLREIKTDDVVRLFINEQALSHAFWVPGWRMTEGITAAIDVLSASAFDARSLCTIDHHSKGLAELYDLLPPAAAGPVSTPVPENVSCSIEEYQPERVTLRVSAPQNGITVLADSYDSGWTANVDGVDAPVLKANGLFRGVATTAGEHIIEWTYRPVPFYFGFGISLVTLIALAGTGLVVFFRKF